MDAYARDSLYLNIRIVPYGNLQAEADGRIRLSDLAGKILEVLHLFWQHPVFWHVQSSRFLEMDKTICQNMVFEQEELILLNLNLQQETCVVSD